ncbi:MAG: hypothetical protein MUE72_03635 [Chitinophagaceae bacterium]|jgi:hypothetical protein|nr:hypothetical protein [Chitinophagaceae bacterium]
MQYSPSFLTDQAKKVLQQCSSTIGIKASLEKADNYNRIWARDSSVAALAILSNNLVELYPAIYSSLNNLLQAAHNNGQIPSNIEVNSTNKIGSISFGGPVGRTDASLWWLIAAISYLKKNPNALFERKIYKAGLKIFKLTETWEFNYKNLMYVPMSSNWADEYITEGYVLYDQILYFWASHIFGKFYKENELIKKSEGIKKSIQQHYLFEHALTKSLYTIAQQNQLNNFDISKNFIASFTPGNRVEKFDVWSIALLFYLNIPCPSSTKKILTALKKEFNKLNKVGLPAFFPIIQANENLYHQLENNFSYSFKNKPGHFHNGGIWPVVNGFLVAGLNTVGEQKFANAVLKSLTQNLSQSFLHHPFAEYFDAYQLKPCGIKNLCFSASGYLLAKSTYTNI